MTLCVTTLRRRALRIFSLGLLATLLLIDARVSHAEGSDDKAATLKVTDVQGTPLTLGREVTVEVNDLPELLKRVNGELSKLLLHLDGHPLTGSVPRRLSIHGDDASKESNDANKLIYDLTPPTDETERKTWNALLGRPQLFPPEPKKVSLSVGPKDQPISPKRDVELRVVNATWLWVFLLALAALMLSFYYLATKSDLLRDPGPDPWKLDENGEKVIQRKPYSLARTQMALWFFVVFASYLFIWLVTSSLVSLTAQVLGLIGISAGTALGAAVIDANKRAALEKQRDDLEKKRNALMSELASLGEQVKVAQQNLTLAADAQQKVALAADLTTLTANVAAKETTLAQTKEELAKLKASAQPLTSDWFLVDILSDDYGVSFHRFQIFAWTLALIVIFITSVYKVLTIPAFDGTLLALMGISSGTYLGLKLPEPRTPPADGTSTTTPTAPDQAAKKPGEK